MNNNEISQLFELQKTFFFRGETRPFAFRKSQLKKLRNTLRKSESKISKALFDDLHKSPFEAYSTEIGFVLEELRYHLRHLGGWMKPKRVGNPLTNFPAAARLFHEPKGTVLIIAPWNYPVQLLLAPLVGAISAGNTVVLKPSELAVNTAKVMEKIINSSFDREYVHVVSGGVETAKHLLSLKFDHIFFTGSPYVGRIVAQEAAKKLIPVTLELGGKSPCIVDKDVDVKLAARRIMWGKLINAGQTCIAPDYLMVHESLKEKLLPELVNAVQSFYGEDPEKSPDYPRIINEPNVQRLGQLIEGADIYHGGKFNLASRYFQPTILDNVDFKMPVMQQEIFGPILPVLTFKNLDELLALSHQMPKPLATYFFSKNKKNQQRITNEFQAGGICINDTIMHIVNPKLPFGGIGNSGIGAYHGKYSFTTFSHAKPVVNKANWLDMPIRYAPFKNKLNIIKKLMK
jgi:aldehyde dehydrogenase (NAD+)